MMEEIVKKLRYKHGSAAVVNAPDGFRLGIESNDASCQNEFTLLFVNNSDEVKSLLSETISSLNEDALFWIAFPKKSSKVKTDINRDILASLVQELSAYRPVSNVSIDDKWSALRFRHTDLVKTKK
ncbi:hypothetical protein [Mesobacillus subterraneus]|uniref:DUF3052 domain-containing protein n=1 Tax=Mesobacillus subterraneus TaxID=285983 RepID=A0A3R9FFT3_9BACI|nr:hypothetical protein [Mesobacillus subterraneus]RSD25404.1 hypothetical protein EJA10_16475 [Mesobacillus subterraneus]